jgi:hypothetical protein
MGFGSLLRAKPRCETSGPIPAEPAGRIYLRTATFGAVAGGAAGSVAPSSNAGS